MLLQGVSSRDSRISSFTNLCESPLSNPSGQKVPQGPVAELSQRVTSQQGSCWGSEHLKVWIAASWIEILGSLPGLPANSAETSKQIPPQAQCLSTQPELKVALGSE